LSRAPKQTWNNEKSGLISFFLCSLVCWVYFH